MSLVWRVGRAVECGGLENRYAKASGVRIPHTPPPFARRASYGWPSAIRTDRLVDQRRVVTRSLGEGLPTKLFNGHVVKLVYTYASGAYGAIRESSSLSVPTIELSSINQKKDEKPVPSSELSELSREVSPCPPSINFM